MSALLELQKVSRSFGGLHVNRDVSFSLGKGDRVALIGPNRAAPVGLTYDRGRDWNPISVAMMGLPVVALTLRSQAR